MEDNAAALQTAVNSVQALGRGFDVNYDTRLLYCKGTAGSRVVAVDEEHTWDLPLYDDIVVSNVPRDIKNSQQSPGRQISGVCSFHEMVEYFNQKANLSGSFPLGSFNSAFSFTGSKNVDVVTTKTLSMDGFYIPLAKVQLMKTPLVLQENVKQAVPTFWDPPSLASFIENFGTHVITSITIGGKDVIYVKQHKSSPLSTMEIKKYIQDIGNQRFSDMESYTSSGQMKVKDKGVDPGLFNSQGIYPQPTAAPYLTGKEDVTVIFRRRGGDDLEQNHTRWARTVRSSPDVIEMSFSPITALLDGVAGKEHLTRAIGLYLEYKPQVEELRYFLEFQIPRIWAPVHDRIAGHQRKEPVCPSLQFSIMGQKLYVSQEQISVGRRPVTGLRLFLEGNKQNRLCIHLQHVASLPKILQPYWDTHVAIGAPKWQGPEEQDSRWFEPVKWRKFSHVSTALVENPETFIGDLAGVYIVTGAQLGVWDFGSRNVLYMKLLYSRLPGCTVRRSLWDHAPNDKSKKVVSTDSNGNTDDSSSGSRGNLAGNKLVKFVDTSEMSKGPEDPPGHWLVTGGKLGVEKGKIVLRVKYSLLNY
ncbi:MACPF domain-containing protein CAD1-like [Juglans microcarpa x Juglans regia]|uniref:MACPF domain-containing protein CAD1-like n=1 Tax=Juglans microcarpa x Juglans regia TaxID=2249226 RepID=UPI001B7E0235|nr:MACPF domain-containing protein CAD1-like [Juglans microcarpa x Juglans regia]